MSISSLAYEAVAFGASLALGPPFLFYKRGRTRILERYGSWNVPGGSYTWFHGASIGEVNGLVPLIREWRSNHPGEDTILTATSITGLERGGNITSVSRLLPFDSSIWINRAIKDLVVKKFIFGETEIWPGLLNNLHASGVKTYMVNARIEERSMRLYEGLLGSVFKDALRKVTCFCISTEATKERLLRLGVSDERVIVTGNAKYDLEGVKIGEDERMELKKKLFSNDLPIIVFGSVRTGEEDIFYDAIRSVEGINFVVAPRHSERFLYFEERLSKAGINYHKWSTEGKNDTNICLLDAFGVLPKCYKVASGAVIGGTLKPYGGHNPLEASGIPIAIGQYTDHIQDIVDELRAEGGYTPVATTSEIAAFAARVRDGGLKELGERSTKVALKMKGATERILRVIND